TALRQRTEQAYESESLARRAAGDHLRQWQRLADVQVLEQLQAEEAELWPARPERAEAMRRWIRTARGLLARRPDHESDLAELERRAAAVPEDERQRGREEHPQWEALGFTRERIKELEGLRSEEADPEEAGLIETALAEARSVAASIEMSLEAIPTMRFED